jgi:ankyrin repeat protein
LVGLGACGVADAPNVAARAEPGSILEAVLVGDQAGVREFVAQGVDVNTAESDGTTLLMRAIHGGRPEIAKILIDAGADVRAANRYGVTPLYLAARSADAEAARALLAAGADANTESADGVTVLMTAAKAGNPAIVEALLGGSTEGAATVATSGYSGGNAVLAPVNRADPNARENWHAQTALMWAASEGHADVVRVLLDRGADPNATSRSGNTALHIATMRGWTQVIELLAEHGAALDVRNARGRTPLDLALGVPEERIPYNEAAATLLQRLAGA